MSSRRDSLKDIPFEKSVHAGLWLDKYIKDQVADKVKSDLVKDVSTTSPPALYDTFYKRWEKTLTEFGARPREATVLGRMIIGLGDESVLETSVTLHHTYGVPYIPGSALKGLAASCVRQKLGEEWKKEREAYKTIFGETDEAGYITFFDAYYVPGSGHRYKEKMQALYPDVITVHHSNYYQGKGDAPADWDSPIPVPFLSATGKYLIALAAPELQEATQWIERTFEILGLALKTMGIGAKTSSGYGRMKFLPPPAEPVDPEVKKAEGYKREIDAIKDVAGQIPGYYQKWQQIKSEEARMLVARAIVEKVRKAGREKATAEKAWYKELLAFLGEA